MPQMATELVLSNEPTRSGQERIRAALLPNGRVRPVPRIHVGIVAEREQHGSNRSHQRVVIAPGQIDASHRALKENVAGEQRRCVPDRVRNVTRAVTRREDHLECQAGQRRTQNGRPQQRILRLKD